MRSSASRIPPGPHGRGFSVGAAFRLGLIIATLVVSVASMTPASAATVNVTLDVSALQPFGTVPYQECQVTVEENANGADVLEAAKQAGCIDSYSTPATSFGRYVDCIDGVCSTAVTYWRMTENGTYTTYGIDDFQANAGDVLGFSYTTWVACLASADPAVC